MEKIMAFKTRRKNKGAFFKFRKQQELFAWSFVIIPLTMMIISWVFINGQSVVMAFQHEYDGWGFQNFKDLYADFTDPYKSNNLLQTVLNTLTYFVCQEFIGIPLSLFVSYFIYKKISGYKAFRVIFYLPSIIPAMVFVTGFQQILAPDGVFERIVLKIKDNKIAHLPTEKGQRFYGLCPLFLRSTVYVDTNVFE